MGNDAAWLKDHIRDIPDFPKPGVAFKDWSPRLGITYDLTGDGRSDAVVVGVRVLAHLGRALEKACETAGVEVENTWERELMEQMRPSGDLWRSMSRRSMAR